MIENRQAPQNNVSAEEDKKKKRNRLILIIALAGGSFLMVICCLIGIFADTPDETKKEEVTIQEENNEDKQEAEDKEKFRVTILDPENNIEVENSEIRVGGKVSITKPEVEVKVNNSKVEMQEDGSFETQISLNDGENVIKVEARVGEQTATDSQKVTKVTKLDKLWEALDKNIKNREGYDIEYAQEQKQAKIKFSSDSFWDENTMVSGAYSTLVKFGKEAFQIEGVESINVIYRAPFTDSYGKEGEDDAVSITMEKAEFEKFDWDNLKYQPGIYDRMVESCSKHYIHPAVLKNIKKDKIYLP
ncbi:MAG: Ig-like domain-containing protein [Parcubacteria group bacterium]|nr:Ig-like domain-containing protein [Parcubacteria group bacterium]